MKILKVIGIFLLIGICFSCSDPVLSKEQEAQNLSQMLSEIESLASSVTCTDSSEWIFTSYGSKACGGPMGFIAYSRNIDAVLFLAKIDEHRIAQQKFNEKWSVVSDCSVPSQPIEVICQNENPVFEY